MELKFNLHDKVNIFSLNKDIWGIVISIWITSKGIKYEVRYFWEGKSQEVYFYDWELTKANGLGFKP